MGSLYASPRSSLPRASMTRPTLVKGASLLNFFTKKQQVRMDSEEAKPLIGGERAGCWKEKLGALRVGGPGGRRGVREPGEAAVVEHPVDGEGDVRAEQGPAELPPHGGGVRGAGAGLVEHEPEGCVERGGVRPGRRGGQVAGRDRAQGFVRRGGGHDVLLLQLLLLLLLSR